MTELKPKDEDRLTSEIIRRVRVRAWPDKGGWTYQIIDESTLEVVATRKTPKGALNAAERWVAGERVR